MSNLLGIKQYQNLIDEIDDLTSTINILVSTINPTFPEIIPMSK